MDPKESAEKLKDITPAIFPMLLFLAAGVWTVREIIRDVKVADRDIREALQLQLRPPKSEKP